MPVAGAVGTSLYLSTWQRDLTWTDTLAIIAGGSTQHIEDIGLGPAVRSINRSIGAPEKILAFDPWAYPDNRLRIAAAQAFREAALHRVEAAPGRYAGHVAHNLWALWITKRYDGVPTVVGVALDDFVRGRVPARTGRNGYSALAPARVGSSTLLHPSDLVPCRHSSVAAYGSPVHGSDTTAVDDVRRCFRGVGAEQAVEDGRGLWTRG